MAEKVRSKICLQRPEGVTGYVTGNSSLTLAKEIKYLKQRML